MSPCAGGSVIAFAALNSRGLRAQPSTARRIAFAGAGLPEADAKRLSLLLAALADLGWKEGTSLHIDTAWGQNDPARYRKVVADLIAKAPELLVVPRDTEAKSVLSETGAVPLLFASGFDPIGTGVVQSLSRPGGTVTGISIQNRELSAKRLGLLKDALPQLSRVGALYRAGEANALHWLKATTDQGRSHGMQVLPAPIARREDLTAAFAAFSRQGAKAVMNIADRLFFETRVELARLALEHRMASIGGVSEFAEAGALLAYAPDSGLAWKLLAGFVDRILKGAKPATMPVEQVNVYELVVNLGTAKTLGIKLPQAILLQATRVIE